MQQIDTKYSFKIYSIASWCIILFGAICRVFSYLCNRSLWHDEAKYALRIIHHSFFEQSIPLFTSLPLIKGQPGPWLFFIFEKGLISLIGNSEYALRLFPLLCGIASLFLFRRLVRLFLKPLTGIVALLLFSANFSLIYFSTEFHPYSSDVMFAILAYLLFEGIRGSKFSVSQYLLYVVSGAIMILSSFPVVFMFAGLGTAELLRTFKKENKNEFYRILGILSSWVVVFVFYYLFYIRGYSQKLVFNEASPYIPGLPLSILHLKWFVNKFCGIFDSIPLYFDFWVFALALFFIGIISSFVKNKNNSYLLTFPMFFALIAAALHKYPFTGRLVVFLVPSFIILVCYGLELLLERVKYRKIISAVLILCLVFGPLKLAIKTFFKPFAREEIKPLLTKIIENKGNDELLYVSSKSYPAFNYYVDSRGMKVSNFVYGTGTSNMPVKYYEDFNKLPNSGKIWFLFAHDYGDGFKDFVRYLDSVGTKVYHFKQSGANLFVYDFS